MCAVYRETRHYTATSAAAANLFTLLALIDFDVRKSCRTLRDAKSCEQVHPAEQTKKTVTRQRSGHETKLESVLLFIQPNRQTNKHWPILKI